MVHTLDVPAHIELAFEGGTPIAVNGIIMPLEELNESLSTIAGDHGFDERTSAEAIPATLAETVVACAREALATAQEHVTGVVRLKLHHGQRTVLSVSPASSLQPS